MDISKLLADPVPHHIQSRPAANHRRRSASSSSASPDPKRQVCPTCKSSFVSKAHLAIHERTVHQRLKPYQCNICNASFGQPGTLTRHKVAVHEKRKDHECFFPGCGKRFGSKWTLSVHEKNVHEKLKPYTCSVPGCDRRFGNLWNQKKHETHVHAAHGTRPEPRPHKSSPMRRNSSSSSEASGAGLYARDRSITKTPHSSHPSTRKEDAYMAPPPVESRSRKEYRPRR